ncbi:MAG: hypothetical protein JSV49_11615 [Thermoplasmata archaeon]|nr:MAG: hypothetical protein JSV49_11615 [Thermoplasmata archaeon]
MAQSKDIPIIDICGKRMFDYILETLGKFNWGANEGTIRAVGRNISRGVEISQILNTRGFNINISSVNLNTIEIEEQGKYSCIEITIKCDTKAGGADNIKYKRDRTKRDFIDYPIYDILFDSLLHTRNQLDILTHNDKKLISINKSGWGYECWLDRTSGDQNNGDGYTTLNKLTEACYRSGLLLSPVWEKTAKELSKTDDIIIGVDTCILYDAALTEQVLNSLSITGSRRHFHTPNWLLVVIPSAVMQELERTANIRDNKGFLKFKGRMGFRALQEILELNQAKDLIGISLIIFGSVNPELDTRVELQGLRSDLPYHLGEMFRKLQKSGAEDLDRYQDDKPYEQAFTRLSSGDMIIRDQFKQFLRQIDFHKGMYFVTSDKSNAALAHTEGLNSIYYTKPPFYLLKESDEKPIRPQRIRFKEPGGQGSGEITMCVPLGKFIYELAVGFGTIKIKSEAEEIRVQCDGKGESLDYWLYKDLMIRRDDMQKLLKNYEQSGRFSLDKVKNLWEYIKKPVE